MFSGHLELIVTSLVQLFERQRKHGSDIQDGVMILFHMVNLISIICISLGHQR